MSEPTRLSRRNFILGSTAALAGCSPDSQKKSSLPPPIAATDAKPNLYKTLEQYEFRGQDGKKIDMKSLEAANRNKRATLSFGFDGCSVFCPPNNIALAQIGKTDRNLVHYVVNVDPMKMMSDDPVQEKIAQRLRDDYAKLMTDVGVNPRQLVVLYPKSTEAANEIPAKLGFTPPPKNAGPDSHYASIVLYDKGGKYIDRRLAADAPMAWTRTLEEGVSR